LEIAILSDTHNRIHALEAAIAYLQLRQITTVFHCGDVTTADTARLLTGFTVHYVIGNGDADAKEITRLLSAANPDSTGGMVFSGEIGGAKIAATHGHLPGKVIELAASQAYDFVFHGHTHIQRDDIIHGTRVINPGSLGSPRYAGRTLCILELLTGQAEYPLIE